MTAEIATAALSAPEARALTDRIRGTLRTSYDLITQAFAGQAWRALGYGSWDDYCAGEFCELRMVKLEREQRREIVGQMRAVGMSTRAIASGLSVAQSTIADDVRSTDRIRSVEEPATVTSLDGRQRPAFAAATNRHPEPERLPRPERSVQVVESAQDVADHLAAIDDALRDEVVDTATGEVVAAAECAPGAPAGKKRRTFDRHAALNVGADLQRVNNRIYKLANDDLLDKHLDLVRRHVGFEASHTLIAVAQLLNRFGAERLPQSEEARAAWATSLLNAAETLQRLGHSLQQEQ